jgi:hypothetical protein
MTPDERLNYCRVCHNRKMNPAIGLVCGLTNAKPVFDPSCPDIKVDQAEASRLVKLEREAKEGDDPAVGGTSLERKAISMGVVGGIIMIVVAAVWFFAGLAAGYVFFYPPILAVIGIYAIVKGVIKT